MRVFATWVILGALCGGPRWAGAQLQLVAGKEPQQVFAGVLRTIPVCWHNESSTTSEVDIQIRLVQLTSTTAAPVYGTTWKRLRVLSGQTVVETASLDLPAVKAATRFLVQWTAGSNQVLGSTEICVYPTNLLSELRAVDGKEDGALGIFDPQNQIKPLLNEAKVDFVDLGNTILENFRGKLAIVGSFESKTQMDPMLPSKIKTLAENSVAVVWVQPSPNGSFCSEREELQPSFYEVPENQHAAIIVQPEMVANLAGNPQSQLNLIYFCKLALRPQPLTLPSWKKQP